jgi:hypothetical protein
MKAERPALGISRSETWSDAQVYHVECSCTDPDHALTVWVEVSSELDFPEVEVTLYAKTNFRRWDNIRERVKIAWKVLFGNGYEQNHSMLLKKQAALNFAAALEAAIEDLENGNSQPDA